MKPIIAVDIDDVLAANAKGFIAFCNATWGHDFSVDETRQWINTRFPNVFSEIHFAGLYDDGAGSGAYSRTKADLLQQIGAIYVIDDQLKHCIAAEDRGIKALLFGDYVWNAQAPAHLNRCVSWQEVEDFLL